MPDSQKILEAIDSIRIVPLFTHDQPDDALEVVRTAYNAGIRAFEFTNRRPNSFEVFQHLISKRNLFSGIYLGIGTIMDGPTTTKFINAGADFIISPILKLEMGTVCRDRGIPWIPGCGTLTEAATAHEHGASLIKLFPGSVLGPAFVQAVKPVVPDIKWMITGGVEPTRESLSSWFQAGAHCVGMGSQLFSKDILQNRDWKLLGERISKCLAIAKEVRGNQAS